MTLHTCMIRAGIRTSERFGRLNFLHRDFFYGLLSAAHKDGWFEANAMKLRAALYAPCLGKVSERDLKDGLLKLREVELIKLWTGRNGHPYGQIINYGQRFSYGSDLPDEARPPSDELPFDIQPPDPPGRKDPPKMAPPLDPPIQSRVERGREETKTPAPENHEAWLTRLRAAYPHIDIARELRDAQKNRRQAGKGLDRLWFERHWLDNIGLPVEQGTNGTDRTEPIEPEPEAWLEYLKDGYDGEAWAETAALYDWKLLPANWRAKLARELKGRKSA